MEKGRLAARKLAARKVKSEMKRPTPVSEQTVPPLHYALSTVSAALYYAARLPRGGEGISCSMGKHSVVNLMRAITQVSQRFAKSELVACAWRYETWSALGWADIKYRYRRTALGPFWLTLSTGAMVLSVGLVYSGLFGSDASNYLPFLATGMITWTLCSAIILDGCNVFVSAAGYIKSVPMPLAMYVYRLIFRNLIILVHNMVLVGVIWLLLPWVLGWNVLLAVPGLILNLVALSGAVLLLGTLCARFRDIPQIIAAIMQLLFLLTPIVWMPNSLRTGRMEFVIDWNPLYYLIEIVRAPLLGQPLPARVWLMASLIAGLSMALGATFFVRHRHRIAYWL
jgi:ABC-type polysaccharide/polyol phosphate export permease